MHRPNIISVLLVSTAILASVSNAVGQNKDEPRLAVDTVSVKNHGQIRGFVLSAIPSEDTVVAVTKVWLAKDDPALLAKTEEAAKLEAVRARMQLRDRIKLLLEEQNERAVRNAAVQLFLQRELDRMESEMANPLDSDYQFVVLRLKSSTISSRNVASEANRRLAVWSWHERLADVESRKPSSLANELKTKSIVFTEIPPDVSDRFHPVPEGQDEWTLRLAIVNHRLNKSIEFQGSGDIMLPGGAGQKPDMASLMGQIMRSHMNALFKDLTGNPQKAKPSKIEEAEWIKSAISKAEKMDERYFLATSVRIDLNGDVATVEAAFMVRLESGTWALVFKTEASQSAADQSQESIKRIANDPQVQTIQSHFESLAGGDASLDKAIRIGAATMSSQRLVKQQFLQFTEKYLRRLNCPPIQVWK